MISPTWVETELMRRNVAQVVEREGKGRTALLLDHDGRIVAASSRLRQRGLLLSSALAAWQPARQMQNGGPAIGTTAPRIPHANISSYEGVVPKTVNWRTLGGGSEAPRERVA